MTDDRGALSGQGWALPRKPLCVNRGRELQKFRELEEQAARTGTPLLLAVSGGSGIGKTTLIVTAAYELGSRYPDVLFAADAAGNIGTAADSNDVAAVLLVQLGVPWQDIPAPHLRLPVLRSKLGGRQLLLVLDDIRSAEQVLPLLGDLRHAAVVVAGERHLDRLRIAGFESLKLKGFEPGEGADYLVAMAGPEIAEADRAVLERLVVLCGGVPQLVAAAAATLADGAEPIDEYVQRLERAATLDELSDDLRIDNECVVDTVGDAGYDGLTDDEARAYRWLSMHPGTCFDLGFAAALLELPVPRVRRLIRELVDRSLIQARGDGYFEFAHVFRQHAIDKAHTIDITPGPRRIRERAIQVNMERAVALARSISDRPIPAAEPGKVFAATQRAHDGHGVERAYAELAIRWPALVDAARQAVELGQQNAAIVLPIALWPFAYHTYRVTELIDIYRTVSDIADDPTMDWPSLGDAGTRWQLARDLGGLYERLGGSENLEQARTWFERALTFDYPAGRASCLEWLGIVRERQGFPEQASALFDDAESALELIPDTAVRQRALALLEMHRGRCLVTVGLVDRAEHQLRAAISFFDTRSADGNNAARCRVLLGDICDLRGDDVAARRMWNDELGVLLRHGMRAEAAAVHRKLARLADRAGDSIAAQDHRDQADEFCPLP